MKTLFEDKIDQFLEYLERQRCMTKRSVYNHGLYLRRTERELKKPLLKVLRGSEIEAAIWEASKHRKRTWNGGNMKDEGAGWRKRCASKIVNFYVWAFQELHIQRNPYPKNTFKSVYTPEADFLTEEEYELLITCDRLDIRDMMMIRFFYDTGFRISESVNVPIEGINWDTNIASAYSVKEHRMKYQPFTDTTKYWIQIVVGMRRVRSKWLFCHPETGEQSTDKSLRDRFVEISKIVGFRVHPHMLRHTVGTHMTKHVGLEQASKHLGHSSLEMTMHYDHVTAERKKENQKILVSEIKTKKNILIGS